MKTTKRTLVTGEEEWTIQAEYDEDSSVQELCQSIKKSLTITKLFFSDCTLTSASINLLLSSVLANVQIQDIAWMFKADLNAQNVQSIAKLIKQTTALNRISFGGSHSIHAENFSLIPEALARNAVLTRVSFFNLVLTEGETKQLIDVVISNPKILEFHFSDSKLHAQNFKFLANKISANSTMVKLYLGYNKCTLTVNDLEYITKRFAENSTLTSLDMTGTLSKYRFDDQSVEIAVRNTNLITLKPSSTEVASLLSRRQDRITGGYGVLSGKDNTECKHSYMQILYSCFLGDRKLKSVYEDASIDILLSYSFAKVPQLKEFYCCCVDVPQDIINELIRAWMYAEYRQELLTFKLL